MKSFCLLLFVISVVSATQKLETVYEWKYIDYLWDSPEHKEEFIKNGNYDYKNIVPIDVDKAKDGRIFVSVIRDNGVPASLSTVTDQMGSSGPLLKPYPNWSWYKKGDCDGITSVYRVTHVFDLESDKLVKRIRIPDNVSQNKQGVGKLVTPVLETYGAHCELENIFMADVNGYGLVIYNKQRGSFRLEANIFDPEPFQSNVTIAGETFALQDSLMGMALLPLGFGENHLILRPFASKALHGAKTKDLAQSVNGNTIKYKSRSNMLPSQATAMGTSSEGVLFFGLTQQMAIGCWNGRQAMAPWNLDIAVQNKTHLQFISGLKVIPRSRTGTDEEVWALSNRLQKIMTGTIDFNEINFRVTKGSVDSLLKGTQCNQS